jgi:hypothetical protein
MSEIMKPTDANNVIAFASAHVVVRLVVVVRCLAP